MATTRIVKVFLASSITELEDERDAMDSICSDIENLFKQDKVIVRFERCERYHKGNTGEEDQEFYDHKLLECDMSLFLFKNLKSNSG